MMFHRWGWPHSVFQSVSIGFMAGILVVSYRFCISKTDTLRGYMVANWGGFSWIVLTILVVFILESIVQRLPSISGSGIPQVKALVSGKIDYEPLRVLICKFIGGVLAIFNGLSLGREGPSIQIGSTIGHLFYSSSKNVSERKRLIVISASAGLAAAFNAPLAAIAFSIEELQMDFSVFSVVDCAIAAISADFVSRSFFGMTPALHIQLEKVLPLKHYLLVIILGVVLGVVGSFFERVLLYFVDIFGSFKKFRILIPTALAWILMYNLPQVLGGGHELITHSSLGLFSLKTILILLVTKFLFTLISYSSKAPGGLFLPMVAIGAMIGASYSKTIALMNGIDSFYLPNFVILGISGFLTAVVKAPLTSIVLTTELVGSLNHFASLMLVSIVAYLVSRFFNTNPIYDDLLNKILQGTCDKSCDSPQKEIKEIIADSEK